MAKLYFRHGSMGSAKTLNLLAVAHNYRQQGKEVLLVKPSLDDRFGKEEIKSRAGLHAKADILLGKDDKIDSSFLEGISCIVVDEAQFLSPNQIEQFRDITLKNNVPVICYGLRTDFKSHLFDGSKRLMELADTIEELKTTCHFCERKALFNLKHVNGVATIEGPSIQLGAEEMYFPVCAHCYKNEVAKAKEKALMAAAID